MKKIILLVCLFCLIPVLACAASWSVTVSWTKSVGPNLAYEEVLYSGTSKCSITPPAVTTCNFSIPTLTGDIVVRSYNSQGAFKDTTSIPVQVEPAAASGIIVTLTYVP